ncbi:MAG: hypothetical protein AB8G95_08235 [Anaerolineae bacterium]
MTIYDLRFSPKRLASGLLVTLLLITGCTERVVVEDKFDGRSPLVWKLESDEQGQTAIQDGQLTFSIPAAGVARYVAAEGLIVGDFVAQVEVMQLAGSKNSGYGMVFRMQDVLSTTPQFYRFDITGNGRFMVEKRTAENGWERLTDGWQDTTLLLTGFDNRNLLKVEAQGSDLGFFINGFEVFSVNDSTYSSGGFGLDAGTFDQGGLVVAFDNFSLETR